MNGYLQFPFFIIQNPLALSPTQPIYLPQQIKPINPPNQPLITSQMQGEQNNLVKQQLIRELKQLSSKQTMIQYYMSYDFPQKQRAVKAWWEELIQNVIKKKNQIYVTFKDLETIASINTLKPVPLKSILKQLKKECVFIKEDDITQDKKPQKKVKPWYTSIISFAWSTDDKDYVNFPFTFDSSQKIISTKTKQRKKKELLYALQDQLAHQHSRFLRDLIKQLSWALKIDEASVQLLLKELKRQRQVVISNAENFGDQVLIYCQDSKLMDENFVKIQKIKCLLRGSLQRFEVSYDKSSAKISNLKLKAKQSLINNDKNKAKVIVTQIRKQEEHRQKIDIQRQILQQKIAQIQVNQMNKSSIDLLEQAQNAYRQVAVDPQKFQEVIQKSREIQMQSDQATKKFQQLAASDEIEDEVDQLMKEIEKEVSSKKKVEPQTVRVATENKSKEVETDRKQNVLHLN